MSTSTGSYSCKLCRDSGMRMFADVENGPEFDSEGPCDCAAGDALVGDASRYPDEQSCPNPDCNGSRDHEGACVVGKAEQLLAEFDDGSAVIRLAISEGYTLEEDPHVGVPYFSRTFASGRTGQFLHEQPDGGELLLKLPKLHGAVQWVLLDAGGHLLTHGTRQGVLAAINAIAVLS